MTSPIDSTVESLASRFGWKLGSYPGGIAVWLPHEYCPNRTTYITPIVAANYPLIAEVLCQWLFTTRPDVTQEVFFQRVINFTSNVAEWSAPTSCALILAVSSFIDER